MAKRKQIDWEAIEREYRLGQKTVRTIGAEFKCAHTSIIRKAKKEGWVQDKSKEVRQRTKAALVAHQREGTKERTTPTREDVDRAVQTNVEVILGHRKSVRKGMALIDFLAAQLKEAAEDRDRLEKEIVEATAEVGPGGQHRTDIKRRISMLKAISLTAHAGVIRDLSAALKNLIPLERQALNMDDDSEMTALKGLLEKLSPETRERLSGMFGDDADGN